MPLSRSIFKYAPLFLFFVLTACKDIDRDNILDPKNPDSYRALTTMIEAFVNTENDQFYNQDMIAALNSIKEQHGDKVVIAHFHRHAGTFMDSLSGQENEILYEKYIDQIDTGCIYKRTGYQDQGCIFCPGRPAENRGKTPASVDRKQLFYDRTILKKRKWIRANIRQTGPSRLAGGRRPFFTTGYNRKT